MMKKSTFGAILAFLFAAAGALTAGALYLRRQKTRCSDVLGSAVPVPVPWCRPFRFIVKCFIIKDMESSC